jgi:hypothetical protein
MKFDFSCDAVVSTTIEAESMVKAQAQWDAFCDSLAMSDDLQNNDGDHFYVRMEDQDPEVTNVRQK